MTNESQEILKELREIRIEIQSIKENMPDKEMFLTSKEEEILQESYENEKKGETISSKALRKELGI